MITLFVAVALSLFTPSSGSGASEPKCTKPLSAMDLLLGKMKDRALKKIPLDNRVELKTSRLVLTPLSRDHLDFFSSLDRIDDIRYQVGPRQNFRPYFNERLIRATEDKLSSTKYGYDAIWIISKNRTPIGFAGLRRFPNELIPHDIVERAAATAKPVNIAPETFILQLSYAIIPEFRRNGFAREVIAKLSEYGQELGSEVVIARVNPDNTPSQLTLEKAGFYNSGMYFGEVWFTSQDFGPKSSDSDLTQF